MEEKSDYVSDNCSHLFFNLIYLNDADDATFGILDWHAQDRLVDKVRPIVDRRIETRIQVGVDDVHCLVI